MSVELLTTLDQLEQLAPEWRGVEGSAAVPLPFATSDWALCWWRHLSEDRRLVRDRMFTLAVRGAGGALLAVLPMMITERPAVGPLRLRCLQYIGADANLTEIRTLTARPEHEAAVYREVLEYLRDARDRWDWVRFTGVRDGAAAALLDGERCRWDGEVTDWVLPLGSSWQELKGGLSRNLKEALRKSVNAPRRDGLEFHLEVARTPAQMTPALDRFFALHASRAAQGGTVLHPDVFRTGSSRRFLRELCDRFSARGVSHIFNLKLGETTIATRLGFRLGSSMYLYFSGYDPAYGKYSAMTSCLAGAIQWSVEAGLTTINLATGADPSKLRWAPQLHRYREARLVSPGLRARAGHAGYTWALEQIGEARARVLFARLLRRRA